MECYETTSAIGEGFWGNTYEFKLVRRQRHYGSRFSQQRRELIDYGVYFRQPAADRWEKRQFVSEDERAAFLAKNVTDLHLTALSEAPTTKSEYLLADLIGESLSSVTFVMDYVQMHFNDHLFNFYNWPVLYEGQALFTHEQDVYNEKLIGLIGKTIRIVDEYLDIGLGLAFEDGPLLSVPLRVEEDFLGPEIVEFRGPEHQWMVWSVGEVPFE